MIKKPIFLIPLAILILGAASLSSTKVQMGLKNMMADSGLFDHLQMDEIAEPDTPSSGELVVYADTADSDLKTKDSTGTVTNLTTGSGSGDVTAGSNLGDNLLIRGDGAAKGVQSSSISIDDSDNVTGVSDIEADTFTSTSADGSHWANFSNTGDGTGNGTDGDFTYDKDVNELRVSNGSNRTQWYPSHTQNLKYIHKRIFKNTTSVTTGTTIEGDFEFDFDGTIQEIGAYNDTAGITGTMVVDVHLNGSTIMTTNKLDIDTTEKTTRTAATAPTLTTTSVSTGDILTFDVDAIHSGTAAKGLTVRLGVSIDPS